MFTFKEAVYTFPLSVGNVFRSFGLSHEIVRRRFPIRHVHISNEIVEFDILINDLLSIINIRKINRQ